jgi:hypothetical protein
MSNELKLNTELVDTEATLVMEPVTKVLKRQPGLGRLNRLIASSTALIVAKGHENKRFKRDYATGIAHYQCPSCGAVAAVGLGQGRGEVHTAGEAFESTCTKNK